MKNFISFFTVIIFAISVFGQKKPTVAAPAFSKQPFDLEITKLPARYLGNDAAAVFNLLNAVKTESECGKFERTDDCKIRVDALYNRPLWLGVTIKDNLAFSMAIDDCDYSADDETLRCPRFKSVLQGFRGEYTWSHKITRNSLINTHAKFKAWQKMRI